MSEKIIDKSTTDKSKKDKSIIVKEKNIEPNNNKSKTNKQSETNKSTTEKPTVNKSKIDKTKSNEVVISKSIINKSTIKNLSDSIDKDVKQLILGTVAGLVILGLIIGQLITQSDDKVKMNEMVLSLMLGTAFGFVLARGAYGFGGAFRRPIQQKDYALPKSVVIFLAITTTLVAMVVMIENTHNLLGGDYTGIIEANGKSTTMSFMFVVGGLVFGMGMILAGTSGSGTLRDIGIGGVGALVVLVGWMFGVFTGFIFKAPIESTWMGESVSFNLFEELGVFLGLIVNLMLIGLVYLILLHFEKKFGKKSTTKTPLEIELENEKDYVRDKVSFISNKRMNRLYFNIFQKKWTLLMTSILLSIVAILSLMDEGGWGVSSTYGYWGAWILEDFGVDVLNINLTGIEGQGITAPGALNAEEFTAGFWNHAGSMYDITIILGAMMAVGLAGRFQIKHRMRHRSVYMFLIGGFVMGFVTNLSGGSNIGALVDPIVVGEISGYVHGVLLVIGAWIAWKIIVKTNSIH